MNSVKSGLKRVDILGVNVSAIDMNDACLAIEEAISCGRKDYVCVCPVSTIMECQENERMLTSVNSAALVTPDGMPVVWLGRMSGFGNMRRVYGPDLMLEVCRISAEKGYKNYFYGSSENVLEGLRDKLAVLYPGLKISGSYSPAFSELTAAEEEEIIRKINGSNSDILWVGLGSPKQDIWMYEHRDRINVPVMVGVGAAFDFISGKKKQAPRFMQRTGTEWLFRLATEPRRLWKRYIFGNTRFLYLICREFLWGNNSKRRRAE